MMEDVCPRCKNQSWNLNGDCSECGTHFQESASDEDIHDMATSIAECMMTFIDNGLTDTDQMNICHGCGRMILYCTCEECNCTMHKRLYNKLKSDTIEFKP